VFCARGRIFDEEKGLKYREVYKFSRVWVYIEQIYNRNLGRLVVSTIEQSKRLKTYHKTARES
jgi:hypothetical protein